MTHRACPGTPERKRNRMDNTTSMDHAEFTARRSLPMMALRGLTVFPGMMLTFEV